MKKILIFIGCFLVSINSFSQKLTYRDLLGKWDKDSVNHSHYYDYFFKDSLNVAYNRPIWGGVGTYKLDTSGNETLLIENGKRLFGSKKAPNFRMTSIIEILKPDTFILRYDDGSKSKYVRKK